MENELILRVCEITDRIYNFNSYVYRIVKCTARTDEPFETLILADEYVSVGDVILVEKCKLVRIDYDSKNVITIVRIDKLQVLDSDTELSKHFNIHFDYVRSCFNN